MSAQSPVRPPLPYRAAIHLLAFALPRSARSEWLAEWSSELWFVSETILSRTASPFLQHRQLISFCSGAVQDLICLRRNRTEICSIRAAGSALTCLALLGISALLCATLAQRLPSVRRATGGSLYHQLTGSVTIWPAGLAEGPVPVLRLATVRSWQRRSQHLFSEFAFYQPIVKSVHIGAHRAPELTIARSSPNLLRVLGVSVTNLQPSSAHDPRPVLILSESTWRSEFGRRSQLLGQSLRVGLQSVRLGGIVPDEAAPAGEHFDAWLLLPDSLAADLPESTRVFAVGHLAAGVEDGLTTAERWPMSVPAASGSADFQCVSISADRSRPWRLFLFTLFLALLSLPAITSLALGEYAPPPSRLPRSISLRRWLFLAGKVCLVLPLVYFGTLDLAYTVTWTSPSTPLYIQLATSFCATLFALQWALHDQNRRCPVCLGKLKCPARVGEPSRNFLTWNGTELICTGGHGLLHVPELPTSWFSKPRWLHLDPSWTGLFANLHEVAGA